MNSKDTGVINSGSIEELIENFNILLGNLQTVISRVRPRTNIKSTKLWQYKKQLAFLSELDNKNIALLISIITKYNSLNKLFSSDYNIIFDENDLIKIIEGKTIYEDKNESYNDTFFELSMALRFTNTTNKAININLDTDCDVIINNKLAIECKYFHSINSAKKNILKALDQINNRISSGLSEQGIIALDFSYVLNVDKVNLFTASVFDEFYLNHLKLHKDAMIAQSSVLYDKNFQKICSGYISHQLEFEFYQILDEEILEKMAPHTLAIVYQINGSLIFEKEGYVIPVPFRAMPYFINPKLDHDTKELTVKLIHSLPTGL